MLSEVDSKLPKLSPYRGHTTSFDNHDYDEPYFEPAYKEEELLSQLRSLSVPVIAEESLQ